MPFSHVKSNTNADWSGVVTVGNSAGMSTTMNASDLVRPSDWNSNHNLIYNLFGNTSNTSQVATFTDVQFGATGPSLTVQGSSNSILFSSPPWISSYEAFPFVGLDSATSGVQNTLNGASVSHCVGFNLPEPGSFSFIRIPVLMTTNSTSVATAAQSCSAFAEILNTWNAVVYSVGTGANSRSLQSVASGSAGFTFQNSVSVAAAGNTYTLTQAMSYAVEGNTTNSTTSTSSAGATSLSFGTGSFTAFTSARWFDINFANSLSAGPYWLVFGYSSNSSGSGGNSTQVSAASNCNIRYSAHYVDPSVNVAFGIMGSTNLSTSPIMAGSFSTAGGGTTNSIPISAISTSASHARPYFQMIRSA